MKTTTEPKGRQDFHILITDDDDRCREALRDIMEPEGFRTLLASSGEEALDIVRGVGVHLVLLDMHMPTLTGLETLQLARQINALLPAILMTADSSQSLMRQALQAHVYTVLPKPIAKNVVLYTVVRALEHCYGVQRRAADKEEPLKEHRGHEGSTAERQDRGQTSGGR
ncbi:MAG TPA: response regulator [Gemmataceae bacterium]|nr:response regulator [Gemmataceae bacterium]